MSAFDAFNPTKTFAQYALEKFNRRSSRSPCLPSQIAVLAYNDAIKFFNTGEYNDALGLAVVAHAFYDENQPMSPLETRIALKQSMERESLGKSNSR